MAPTRAVEGLQRSFSDISLEVVISKEDSREIKGEEAALPAISEVENAKCECCGMCEECTGEYIAEIRDKYGGKLICGLCAAAVKEEMEKKGWGMEEAVGEHMNACFRFNRYGRTHPVLTQAAAMREILKRSSSMDRGGGGGGGGRAIGASNRAKSVSPRDKTGGISRSSSCIPAITREVMMVNVELP